MRFDFPIRKVKSSFRRIPVTARIGVVLFGWLLTVSFLHHWLNGDRNYGKVIRMGYMPVITNLASPLLDHATRDANGLRFQALKFTSFAEMAEALRHNEIQAAFMIAPLSIVLRQQGEDVKIVYIGNRHESTLVVKKDIEVNCLSDLAGKTLAVPMRYSGHNLSILKLLEEKGLRSRVRIVEMNPPDMASALAAGSLDAYYVGEPFAAQTLKSGDSKRLFYVEEVCRDFICNLLLVKQDFIENRPDLVERLVQSAARSGIWAAKNVKAAARIASAYWNQPAELIEYALSTPANRVIFDRFTPQTHEIQQMADQMVHFNLIENSNIRGLIEDRFARAANLENIADFESILYPVRSAEPTKSHLF